MEKWKINERDIVILTVVPKRTKYLEENTSITWKRNVSPHFRESCLFECGVSHQFDKSASAFDIFEKVINLNVLIQLLVQQNNLHLQHNGRNFLNNVKEVKALIGISYIMTINQLLIIPVYCDCDDFIGNR